MTFTKNKKMFHVKQKGVEKMSNYKRMLNMAESIATINSVEIERMDLNKVHMGFDGKFDYYYLNVWFSDGKHIIIREDCSIDVKEG